MKEKPIDDTFDCEKEDIVYLPYFGILGDPNNEYMRDVKTSLAA